MDKYEVRQIETDNGIRYQVWHREENRSVSCLFSKEHDAAKFRRNMICPTIDNSLIELAKKKLFRAGSLDPYEDVIVYDDLKKILCTDNATVAIANYVKALPIEHEYIPTDHSISDELLEAVINEHDMNVPDELLVSPTGFGAHREAMRAALNKIIPVAMKREFGKDISSTMEVIGKVANGVQIILAKESIDYARVANAVAHGLVSLKNAGYIITRIKDAKL